MAIHVDSRRRGQLMDKARNETAAMDLTDIQGNILSGYKAGAATYLFYRVDTVRYGRQWLAALLPEVTTGIHADGENPPSTVNIAVSFQGIKALGVSPKLSYEIEKRPFYITHDGKGVPRMELFAKA